MAQPPRIREGDGGALLAVHVKPRASRNRVVAAPPGLDDGGPLAVQVTAPPVDGAANKAVCEVVAKALGVSKSRVQVHKGQSARRKTLRVEGMSAAELARRIS